MFVCQGAGVCGGQCVPGRRQCVGTTPQVCSPDGMWMNSTGNECLKALGGGVWQRRRVHERQLCRRRVL